MVCSEVTAQISDIGLLPWYAGLRWGAEGQGDLSLYLTGYHIKITSHCNDITRTVLLDSCEGLQGVTENIKARVGRHPLRHVESVEGVHNTQERTEGSAGDTCLGWTEELHPDTEDLSHNRN